jgi:ribosomal protein L4
MRAADINTYEVMKAGKLIITEKAVTSIQENA